MTTAYLCGPVSNGGTLSTERIRQNIAEFRRVKEKFSGTHIEVIDPTNLTPQQTWEDYMKITWEDYMKRSIPILCRASYLVLLPGWEGSRGAVIEVFLANQLNIPIVFSDHLPI